MVAIGRVGSAPAAGPSSPRTPASGFSIDVPSGPAAMPSGVAAAPALGTMAALQECLDAPLRDRQARRHGRAMLAALSGLQAALLGDEDAADALHRLATLAGQQPEPADGALAGALAAITLRVHVELARRGL